MKIESLTLEQKERFSEFMEKWKKIGLSTEPANRKEAEEGIKTAYKIAGKNPPKKIVWCSSPLSQGLTRALIFGLKNSEVGIGDSVRASVGDSVWDSVGDSVWDSVGDSVWASVGDSVWASVWASVGDSVYGQHEAGWLSFYEYFKEACSLNKETYKLTGLWQVAKNAGWWLPHENICWVSERHNVLNLDNNGRLHTNGKMALEYPDKWGIYAFHGLRLPLKYGSVKHENWESKWILEEKNAELRRVLIQGIGYGKIARDLNAKKIDSWKEYELIKIADSIDVEPILMLSMTCPSTTLKHIHRVPPDIETTREAVKWINHGVDKEEFFVET